MPHDQYQIPNQQPEASLQEGLRVRDEQQYTPETQPQAFQVLTNIAEGIWGYRDAALEAEQASKKGLLSAFGLKRPRTTEDLIEKESKIGGRAYGHFSGSRVWLADRSFQYQVNPYDTHETVAHWFYTQAVMSPQGRTEEQTLHYEQRPSSLTKLYNGRTYPLTIAETETFSRLVHFYDNAVREELYPIDGTLHELQDELEREVAPVINIQDALATKALVEEKIIAYKAAQTQGTIIPFPTKQSLGEDERKAA